MKSKIVIHIDIDAAAGAIFDALTTTSALEGWFAESARVSQRQRRYDFWGRFTPYAPDAEGGHHPVLSWAEGVSLSYGWPLRGTDTVVAIALEEREGRTRLSLTHDPPERAEGELSLADFWMLSFENLRRYLRDGASPIRRDYAAPSGRNVELALDIDASPAEVFVGLTDPESLKRWMSATAPEVALEVGGSYRYWEGQGPVEVLAVERDRKLSCRWCYGEDPDTVVTWTLEGSGGRTRLTLVHSGFGREVEDFRTGWLKHLVWLKESLERGPSWMPPVLLTTDCKA